jgi:hypothetical protein
MESLRFWGVFIVGGFGVATASGFPWRAASWGVHWCCTSCRSCFVKMGVVEDWVKVNWKWVIVAGRQAAEVGRSSRVWLPPAKFPGLLEHKKGTRAAKFCLRTPDCGFVRASLTVLLMRDLGPTSAGREALSATSGAAEHCGGGPKLPSAAEFGSFGCFSPTPAQLHSPHLGQLWQTDDNSGHLTPGRQRQADPPPDR